MTMDSLREDVRCVHWSSLALLVTIVLIDAVVTNLYLPDIIDLQALEVSTFALVSGTLVMSLPSLLIALLIVFSWAHLRLSDIGWKRADLIPGLMVTFAFWGAMNLLLGGCLLFDRYGHSVGFWNPQWQIMGGVPLVGRALGQFFGNALYEETVFRGVLLTQLTLIFGKYPAHGKGRRVVVAAVLVSSMIFALYHVPNLFARMANLADEMQRANVSSLDQFIMLLFRLVYLTVGGIMYSAVYLKTRNLFMAVGIHALGNEPLLLVQSNILGLWIPIVFILLIALLCVSWNRLSGWFRFSGERVVNWKVKASAEVNS